MLTTKIASPFSPSLSLRSAVLNENPLAVSIVAMISL